MLTGNPIVAGTVIGGTYRIHRVVGGGGMGEVYEATHLRLSGRYAIKVLRASVATSSDALVRFAREAEITSRLRHPNIVAVHDFNVTDDGRPYLAMEYLEGIDLGRELAVVGALPIDRVVDLVGQIAAGLAVAHAGGVVHRDLKPQNVFLSRVSYQEGEVVKIVDFGISKVMEASMRLTVDSAILGTPQYMSPEQAQGHVAEIDEAADQFALAALTYEMLAGKPPFRGGAVAAVLYQVVHEQPASLRALRPGLAAELEAVVFRGLAKQRHRRFPSVLAFHRALVEAAGASAPSTRDTDLDAVSGEDVGVGAHASLRASGPTTVPLLPAQEATTVPLLPAQDAGITSTLRSAATAFTPAAAPGWRWVRAAAAAAVGLSLGGLIAYALRPTAPPGPASERVADPLPRASAIEIAPIVAPQGATAHPPALATTSPALARTSLTVTPAKATRVRPSTRQAARHDRESARQDVVPSPPTASAELVDPFVPPRPSADAGAPTEARKSRLFLEP
jgi:serine/threonine-protein kinase